MGHAAMQLKEFKEIHGQQICPVFIQPQNNNQITNKLCATAHWQDFSVKFTEVQIPMLC